MASAEEVAAWMARRVKSEGVLSQLDAVEEIEQRLGREHVYHNPKGALAISPTVLDAFRRLTSQDVIWVRGRRFWRQREPEDPPGRLQSR